MEARWSQSRVLPSAELAYETGLSAGSIANDRFFQNEECKVQNHGLAFLALGFSP